MHSTSGVNASQRHNYEWVAFSIIFAFKNTGQKEMCASVSVVAQSVTRLLCIHTKNIHYDLSTVVIQLCPNCI